MKEKSSANLIRKDFTRNKNTPHNYCLRLKTCQELSVSTMGKEPIQSQ